METRNSIPKLLLQVSYVLAPALLAASAFSFVAGITLIPPGITGYVEGVLGCFALMLFVPVYLDLGCRLTQKKKILGAFALICGLAGSVTGYGMELLRVTEYSLRLHGAGDAIWQNWYANMGMEYIAVAIWGPLFPITSVLLGIGFLQTKQFPRWINFLLILAGIGFPLAQVLELPWALRITYPAATLCWLVSLSTIALRHFHPGLEKVTTIPSSSMQMQ